MLYTAMRPVTGVVGGRGTWSDDGSAIAAMREWYWIYRLSIPQSDG